MINKDSSIHKDGASGTEQDDGEMRSEISKKTEPNLYANSGTNLRNPAEQCLLNPAINSSVGLMASKKD